MQVTNHYGVNLLLAVWLVNDNYDHDPDPKAISASALVKPLKKYILGKRVHPANKKMDVADLMASALGSSIHDAIEAVWVDDVKRTKSLDKLGIPRAVQERIKINPDPATVTEDDIPIYFEQRSERLFNGWRITGKFDAVAEGEVNDFKTTGTYSYTKGKKDDDYRYQLSIYKWLNPEIITVTENGKINFGFTDWQGFRANQDAKYPEKRFVTSNYDLMSNAEVEARIAQRLKDIEKYKDAPEDEIPECTPDDLWMDDPTYKYYSDPAKANQPGARSSKNFSCPNEAQAYLMEKGKGIIKTVLGSPKACGYCDAFEICEQKDRYEQL